MSSQDIERANYLRKIFEKMLDKADPKLSFKERLESAKQRMDEKLGPDWSKEMDYDSEDKMSDEAAQPFYVRVAHVGDAEGLGPKGSEAPEEGERSSDSLKKKIMCRLGKLLDDVL